MAWAFFQSVEKVRWTFSTDFLMSRFSDRDAARKAAAARRKRLPQQAFCRHSISHEGESGAAPPVAEQASRFRGSGTIGGSGKSRES